MTALRWLSLLKWPKNHAWHIRLRSFNKHQTLADLFGSLNIETNGLVLQRVQVGATESHWRDVGVCMSVSTLCIFDTRHICFIRLQWNSSYCDFEENKKRNKRYLYLEYVVGVFIATGRVYNKHVNPVYSAFGTWKPWKKKQLGKKKKQKKKLFPTDRPNFWNSVEGKQTYYFFWPNIDGIQLVKLVNAHSCAKFHKLS